MCGFIIWSSTQNAFIFFKVYKYVLSHPHVFRHLFPHLGQNAIGPRADCRQWCFQRKWEKIREIKFQTKSVHFWIIVLDMTNSKTNIPSFSTYATFYDKFYRYIEIEPLPLGLKILKGLMEMRRPGVLKIRVELHVRNHWTALTCMSPHEEVANAIADFRALKTGEHAEEKELNQIPSVMASEQGLAQAWNWSFGFGL